MSGLATNCSTLTITPDAIAQGLLAKIVGYLEAREIKVLFALPKIFSAGEAVMLYNGRITHKSGESRLHSAWLSPELWTGGQSIFLVIRAERDDLVGFIRGFKGRSRHGEVHPGELRSLSPLTDRGFSLIHSPDTHTDVIHELEVVVGRNMSERLELTCRPLASEEVIALGTIEEVHGSTRRPFDILARVYRQVGALFTCAPTSVSQPTLLKSTEAIKTLVDAAKDLNEPSALWSLAKECAPYWNHVYNECLERLNTESDRLEIERVLCRLRLINILRAMSPETFTVRESFSLSEGLTACGLPLTYWNRHLLNIVAAYHSG